MKRKLIALTVAGALSFGTLVALHAEDPAAGGPACAGHHAMMERAHENPLSRLTTDLNLTADQKAKVQPIVDAAKPQVQAIHQEAMQKMKTVMNNAMAQIRPLLTPAQQTKLDAIQKAHEQMHDARKAMHDAEQM